jgi:Ca-activated chloride channel homolog
LASFLHLCALCVSLLAAAQGSTYQEQVDVEWVLVPVVVRQVPPKGGKHAPGSFVRGLEQRDFELTVDGRPVAIGSFEARADAPVSLIHLQDLSGSMALGGKLETSRRALGCFLERARPGDELALASFAGGKIRVDVPLTGDAEAIGEAMAAWRGYGTTALHDAVAWLPDIAVRDRAVKRAALLITDGADNASVLSPAAARALVRQAQLPVYVLGLATGSPFELDPGGGKRHRYADVLNLLAQLTGGRYYSLVGPRDVEAVCDAVDRELRSQYVLGFAAGGSGPSRYRTLEVTVPGRHVEVVHRRGYSGRPPARKAQPRP